MMRKRDSLHYVEVWTNETAGNNTVADPELAMLAPEGMLCQVRDAVTRGQERGSGGGQMGPERGSGG
eukprot:438619-Pyramimonas_sp.AAC.1